MRAADIVARRLYDAGCRYAFGIPGGEVLTMIDALKDAGISFILTKHENSAGFMAEGVFQRTGAPGILVATLGPGAANAVNVVANAEQDRVPMIVLTGCVDEDEVHTYTHQVFDHQQMFRPLTKETYRLTSKSAGVIADKAVSIAMAERQGPVHIDVPIAVAVEDADPGSLFESVVTAARSPAPGEQLDRARAWLSAARRPVVVAGLDVLTQKASQAVAEFAEEFRIPVVTSYKAKGVLPEDAAFAVGGAGLSPVADRHMLPIVRNADLVLAVGYDPIEMRTGWRDPWDPNTQNVVEIASVANRHYMHQASIFFECDVAPALHAISDGVATSSEWQPEDVASIRGKIKKELCVGEEWGPSAIVDETRKVLPRNGMATVDSGAHRILLNQIWDCYEPRTLLQSIGLCTMGCAVPLAMGARISDPDRPAVAFVGDAGLLMFLGELATAGELNLPIAVVVFVDASLALIELKQRGRQMPNVGVDFAPSDFAAIARAMGGHGFDARTRRELSDALISAFEADTFTVIACHIDRKSYDGRI